MITLSTFHSEGITVVCFTVPCRYLTVVILHCQENRKQEESETSFEQLQEVYDIINREDMIYLCEDW